MSDYDYGGCPRCGENNWHNAWRCKTCDPVPEIDGPKPKKPDNLCAICGNEDPKSYTVVKGRDVCMECVDLILRLFPERLAGPVTCPNPECTHGYLLDELSVDRPVPPKCEICEGKGTVDNLSHCEVCGTEIVEVTTHDYAPNYIDWWPVPDLPDYHPCADENGLPAAHVPK